MGSPITWCRPPRCHSDPARRRPSGRVRWPNCGPIRSAAGAWADSRRNRRRTRRRRPAGPRIESPRRLGAQANAPGAASLPACPSKRPRRSGRKCFRSGIGAASFCNAAHPKLKGTGLAPLGRVLARGWTTRLFCRPVSSSRASRRPCAGLGAPRPEDGAKRRAPKSLRTLFTRNRDARCAPGFELDYQSPQYRPV